MSNPRLKREGLTGEDIDFPLLCQTCLGPNAFVRMQRLPNDRACKICERPFVVYRWKPGPEARYKKTEICKSCAKIKNACQTCLFDLKYNLPLQVRDSVLAQEERINLPQNSKERTNVIAKLERDIANGDESALSIYQKDNAVLEHMARNAPKYERNRAKICTFFIRGACQRGKMCPYRHEMPDEKELERMSTTTTIQDRYFGTNDQFADKLLASQHEAKVLAPPTDVNITTLWISLLPVDITVPELREVFKVYGEILNIHYNAEKHYAFVTFARRQSAEEAAVQLYGKLTIKNQLCKLAWAKSAGKVPDTARHAALPLPPGVTKDGKLANATDKPVYASMSADYVAPVVPARPPGI